MLRRRVRFGHTQHEFEAASCPSFVPCLFGPLFPSPNTGAGRAVVRDLEWLLQKDLLGQDMCLIGAPGPYRRRLVSYYCELTQRELETVVLSQDTSEPDLKQRRDLRDGSVVLTPQAPIRAAVLGRVLLLDGIEKAERNVLPTLNNLLENREVNLLHGQRLVGPTHTLSQEALAEIASAADPFAPRTLRASARFRCIALQLPVPTFPGQPIDPPLRSRFQGRICGGPVYMGQRPLPSGTVPTTTATDDVEAALPLRFELPYLEALDVLKAHNAGISDSVARAYVDAVAWMQRTRDEKCSANVPLLPLEALLRRKLSAAEVHSASQSGANESVSSRADGGPPATKLLEAINNRYPLEHVGVLSTRDKDAFEGLPLCGPTASFTTAADVIHEVLTDPSRRHFAVVGPRGCGKSRAIWAALERVGGNGTVRVMTCFRDMSTRDLFQRRVLDDKGDSTWVNSPLVTAAIEGTPVVLDGVHRCVAGVLAALASLIHDSEMVLHSGQRFVSVERFEHLAAMEARRTAGLANSPSLDAAQQTLRERDNVHPVAPGFRIIAVGEPSTFTQPWLNTESMALFAGGFVSLRQPTQEELRATFRHHDNAEHDALLATTVEALADSGLPSSLRFITAMHSEINGAASGRSDSGPGDTAPTAVADFLRRALLLPFRPVTLRQAVDDALQKRGLPPAVSAAHSVAHRSLDYQPCFIDDPFATPALSTARWGNATAVTRGLRIGANGPVLAINGTVRRPELVPNVPLFHVLPSQMRLLRQVTRDLWLGRRNILFIGNQGTGKNKLCDTLLSWLRLEREYVQLHRDTSVQALTLTPSVQGRTLQWEPSPLIQAAIDGRVVVIDEADKAPLEVVVVLKALLADEHLTLIDGRTLRRRTARERAANAAAPGRTVFIHDDFRTFVLANRPGYPFLGNDFFRECGDIFATHIIENPDAESSLQLMSSFAPGVPRGVLARVASAFDGLREKHERGDLSYPFSAREMVGIAKHLQAFPRASVSAAISNVTHFDQFSGPHKKVIDSVLEEHGLVMSELPRVQLGAVATLRPGDGAAPGREASWFAHMDATHMVHHAAKHDLERVSESSVKPRNISNEIEQPWRDHSAALPSFIPPRTFAFTELINTGALPYAKTSYSKRPAHIVPLRDAVRRGGQSGDDAASPGFLVVGHPASLFVCSRDLRDIREIDSGFIGGPVSAACAVGDDWTLLVSDAAASYYLLNVGKCRLRKFALPLDLFATRTTRQVGACVPPALTKLGARYVNADEVLSAACGRDGSLVVLHRATGALFAARLDVTDGSYSPTLFAPALLQSLLDALCADGWSIGRGFKLRTVQVTLSKADSMDQASVVKVELSWTVTHSSVSDRQLFGSTTLHRGEGGAGWSCSTQLHDNAAPANATPGATLQQVLRRSAGDLTCAVSRSPSHIYLTTWGEMQAPVVTRLPGGLVAATHDITFGTPFENIGARKMHFPAFIAPKDASASLTSYFALATIDVGDEATRRVATIRRVAIGPHHPAIIAAGDDGLPDALVYCGDSSGGLHVFEMSDSTIGASLAEWRAQLGTDDSARSFGDGDIQVVQVSDDGHEEADVLSWTDGGRDLPLSRPTNDASSAASGGALAEGGGSMASSGSGIGAGAGGGMGGGSGGDGTGSGGQGADKESDGLGGYAFDAEGEAVINARRRRQTSNVVKKALATGDVSYDRYLDNIADSVAVVSLAIETLEAAHKEREWLANSTFGELDDRRLVDAVAGESNVFMVRGTPAQPAGAPQRRPKYMDVVVDLSASMARFNAFDGRLDRLCESLVLLMEAARGLEHKFVFEVHAHSGSAVRLPLLVCDSIYRDDAEKHQHVEGGPLSKSPVKTDSGAVRYEQLGDARARGNVVSKAVSHSRMAMTGDGTVEGLKLALENAAQNIDADEAFVVLVSDANLGGYGVSPKEIGDLIEQYRAHKVRCHVVFIAEQHAADWFTRQLPAGSASLCTATSDLPNVLLAIWSEALLDGL